MHAYLFLGTYVTVLGLSGNEEKRNKRTLNLTIDLFSKVLHTFVSMAGWVSNNNFDVFVIVIIIKLRKQGKKP